MRPSCWYVRCVNVDPPRPPHLVRFGTIYIVAGMLLALVGLALFGGFHP
jgi:hypothetical protein